MGMKNPVVATCPNCGKPNVLICTVCWLCGGCSNHEKCNTDTSNAHTAFNSLGIEMLRVEGGSFQMGSTNGETNESPVHSVTVSSFYIGKYPVTQKEWFEIMGSNPSYFKGDKRPIESIDWYQAIDFCNKLSQKEGLTPAYKVSLHTYISCNWQADGYRLPTEAEWEFAARGGNLSKGYEYSGSDYTYEVGWNEDNSRKETKTIGMKKANELGIYDMSGNVWEWCWDYEAKYSSESQTNPKGASTGSYRVVRGGSWSNYDKYCRVANRCSSYPESSSRSLGFRLARTS